MVQLRIIGVIVLDAYQLVDQLLVIADALDPEEDYITVQPLQQVGHLSTFGLSRVRRIVDGCVPTLHQKTFDTLATYFNMSLRAWFVQLLMVF
jgi:hypothetical protein